MGRNSTKKKSMSILVSPLSVQLENKKPESGKRIQRGQERKISLIGSCKLKYQTRHL
uniref:Uncharacterized protein n=1 Tax=Solanum tuberosum TaxID=4113 RepID=M0ZYI3_SOLTU